MRRDFGRAVTLAATIALAACNTDMLVGTMKGDDPTDVHGAVSTDAGGSDVPSADPTDAAQDDAARDISVVPDGADGFGTSVDSSLPDGPSSPDAVRPPDDRTVPPDAPPTGDIIGPEVLGDGALCPSSARAPVACVPPDASLPEMPIESCPVASRLLVRENAELLSLHADAQGVYWLAGDLALRTLPKDAAVPQIVTFIAPQPFTIDSEALYFATGDIAAGFQIQKIKRDGTGLTFIASGAIAGSDIAVGGDRVYFLSASDSIKSANKAGAGGEQTLAAAGNVSNVVADGTHVYWMQATSDASTGTTKAVWRSVHGSSTKEMVAADLSIDLLREQGDGLILLSPSVEPGSGDEVASIREIPKAGGCPRVLVSLPRSRCACRITTLAADDRAIYWTAEGDGGDFSIWYAPRVGGIAVRISSALDDDNLALTPTQVVWSDVVPELTTFDALVQVADRP